MVREPLFLVMSVICVRIRGRGSEVTTSPHHIRSDFRLKRRSCHSGFVVLFLRYLSRKHKTYRYSVLLGTLGVDRTIFGITLSVHLSVCTCLHILSVFPILPGRYLLSRTTIFNQTRYGGVLLQGKLSGRKNKTKQKLVHHRQCQGHSEGLYNQNMTISTISSKLLVRLQSNLVW